MTRLLTREIRLPAPPGRSGGDAGPAGLIAGDLVVSFDRPIGARVDRVPAAAAPQPTSRTPAQAGIPPDVPLLGRAEEVDRVHAELAGGRSVQVHGEPGIGKTAFLRHVANRLSGEGRRVVFLSCVDEPLGDVVQSLFERFYEPGPLVVSTVAAARTHLASIAAVVVLDDLEVSPDEISSLLDAAADSTFLISRRGVARVGDARAVPLDGLADEPALNLLEREAGRRFAGEDRAEAVRLCRGLGGNPLRILQAGAALRDGAELRSLLGTDGRAPLGSLRELLRDRLEPGAKKVLGVLNTLGVTCVLIDRLAPVVGAPLVGDLVADLAKRHLVGEEEECCSSSDPEAASTLADEAGLPEGLIDHVLSWVERIGDAGGEIERSKGLIVAVQRLAAETGRWRAALRIGEAAETTIAAGKRWGSWGQVLEGNLQASRVLGDRAAEARALHQLGVRDLGQGNRGEGRRLLERAREIREDLPDRRGLERTRHNLGLSARPDRRRFPSLPLLAIVLAGLAVVISLVPRWGRPEPTPPTAEQTQTVTSDSVLAVEPRRVRFPPTRVGSSSRPKTVTIRNDSSSTLPISGVVGEGPAAADFDLDLDCPREPLPPRLHCEVQVVFHPSAPGSRPARIVVLAPKDAGAIWVEGIGVQDLSTPTVTVTQTRTVPVPVPTTATESTTTVVRPAVFLCRADASAGEVAHVSANGDGVPCRSRSVSRGSARYADGTAAWTVEGARAHTVGDGRRAASSAAVAFADVRSAAMRVQPLIGRGMRASAAVRCAGGRLLPSSSSEVGGLWIGGRRMYGGSDPRRVEMAGVTVHLNERIRRDGVLVARAARIVLPDGRSLVLAEARAGMVSGECDDGAGVAEASMAGLALALGLALTLGARIQWARPARRRPTFSVGRSGREQEAFEAS